MPEVSIIMPNYNCGRFIGETIESVIAQTFTDWELIICDDGSTDDSLKIIESYTAKDPRIHLLHSGGRKGSGPCRNQAIAHSQGEYIAFLDSDDIWYPQKLEKQIAFMREKDIDICHMAFDVMDEQGVKLDTVVPPAKPMTYRDMLCGQRIQTVTAMAKRSALPLFPALPVAQDVAMWLSATKTGLSAHAMLSPLSCYRLRKKSASSFKPRMVCAVWRIMRDQEKIPLVPRAYYFCFYIFTMLKKYARVLPDVLRLR